MVIGIALLALLVPPVLVMTGVLLWRWRRSPRVSQPSCGKCLYAIEGLPSDICPECGSNFAVVGIIEPGSLRPMHGAVVGVLWTLLLAPLALVLTPIIGDRIPSLMILTTDVTHSDSFLEPIKALEIHGEVSQRGGTVYTVDRMKITAVLADGSKQVMHADLPSKTARWTNPKTNAVEEVPFDVDGGSSVESIAQMLIAHGADAGLPKVSASAMHALSKANYTHQAPTGSFTQPFSSTSSTSSFNGHRSQSTSARTSFAYARDPYKVAMMIAGWVVVWGIGLACVLLVRRLLNRSRSTSVA